MSQDEKDVVQLVGTTLLGELTQEGIVT